MQTIHIIFVGTIKERYLTEAVAEYEKRLSAFCNVHNISIKEERLPEHASNREIAAALKKEGERILAAIPERAYKIGLCIEGKQLPSETFALQFDYLASSGYSDICFLIGGSDGLDDKVKQICDQKLSISAMTFPHQLMRVILLEQIYRAYAILNGSKYHK